MPFASNELDLLYTAYFNRPADVGGIAYWEQQRAHGASVESIALSFGRSQEYQALTASKSHGDVVDMAYQSLFGRAPDAGGKAFWTAHIDSGKFDKGTIVLEIMRGAQAADQLAMNNRAALAEIFTDALGTDAAGAYTVQSAFDVAHAWLAPVGSSPASLETAQGQMSAALAAAIAAGLARIRGNVDHISVDGHAQSNPVVDLGTDTAVPLQIIGVQTLAEALGHLG
jgi:hypothetical protein